MTSIQAAREGGVGIITINRGARFNSLDVETARDLRSAALGFARDTGVRAVVLQGSAGIFCSGADLKYIRDGGATRDLGYLTPETRDVPGGYGEVFKQILEYLHSTISEIRRAPKPFIAAVDGVAAAGGFGLAMSCDIVLASARSSFEWAYGKTGLTGAESSTFLLPRLIGLRRSLELMLLNPRLTATRASDLGLVTWLPCRGVRGLGDGDRAAARAWPHAGIRRGQVASEPGGRGRSTRLPPGPGAGAAGQDCERDGLCGRLEGVL
jgi:2-(1,2-epoxy-1,2-dihydrophenyl)acetyl-CoA isomerase